MLAPGFTDGGRGGNASHGEGFASQGDARNRVLQAIDIVELIGRSVTLKRQGKEFVGLCPFHQEKSPSFYVSPSKQVFLCRGCKKGGNAIDFVMQRDRVEFKDALRQLAEAAGIELPSFGQNKQNASERQALYDAQSAAAMFFEKLLSHLQFGEAARAYLAQRGFTGDSIRQFHIGVAADSWDALLKSQAMKKFTPAQLALAGLVKPRERGDGHYDTFRNRLMFPIRDESSRVIAFGGRVMPGSDDPAKYLNSPETPLFSKSRCVFGLDLARSKIVETRTVAVVEGYTDVVMAHQFGVTNVVSVLGTALTPQHVTILRRFADKIVLLFDADTAGDAAVDRAVELFLTQPVEILIASLPEGIDPDELLLQQGAEAFGKVISEAADALTYKWKQLVRQINASDGLTGQQQAVQQYLQTLAGARGQGPVDPLRWGAALARVSRLTDIPVPELSLRFSKESPKRRNLPRQTIQVLEGGQPKESAQTTLPAARQKAEAFIIGQLMLEPGRWAKVQQELSPQDFADESLQEVARLFWRHQQDEGQVVLNEFLSLLQNEALKSLVMECVDGASEMPEPDAALSGSLQYLLELRRRDEEQKHMAALRRTESSDDLRQLQEKMRQPDLKRIRV